ncbi:iron chelate uptake ABC transporter family permease subunit [Xanthovirga aplysinae]|uniref:metal ABC transporter permease n=1 Tax=Xanthovirga aplysinae TaxID=2529853 RepID=UPI0012BBF0CA|nr:iron chelate uptake ABC transporter family permease subunit [Xanthovirga aplysinae]MTI29640.1 zinc ABC transporter permease [Xanthovirga aplysinae]
MDSLIEFFSFSDPNIRYVVAGSVLLAASAAIVGSFTFLKKKALSGDAVAHSVLPGVCLAFILSGTKNPFYLVLGAFATGWLSLVFIDNIVARSKIKEDTATGLILSVFFGVGILLLTAIQHSGNAAQSGLDQFLFGKAASLVGSDLIVFSSISVILIASVILFFKEFTLIAFDENFAKAIGFPVRGLELLLTTLTVLAVVIGIQAVGVVLMAAMLITPAAAARFWTDKLRVMVILAAFIGAFSGICGAYISYIAPAMPTGPWIVMVLSILAIGSFFLAPRKGIMSRYLLQRKNQNQILEENLLKLFYKMGEKDQDYLKERSLKSIQEKRPYSFRKIKRGLQRLLQQGFLERKKDKWQLTLAGKSKGQRVVKLHRLWELYLTEKMNIAPDHVHDDAETIEHIITPEIERKLEKKLGYPKTDPHQSDIPY